MSTLKVAAIPAETKMCVGCGEVKDRGEFYAKKNRCKPCYIVYSKEKWPEDPERKKAYNRAYYEANREKIKATDQAYRERNRELIREKKKVWWQETREERAAYKRRQYEERGDEIRAQRRVHYQQNRDKILARHLAYVKSERGRLVMKNLNHKRRSRAVDNRTVSHKDLMRLLSSPCANCGHESTNLDHIVPIARGGRHSVGNLQPLCKPCNSSKGSKFLVEWRRDRAVQAALSKVA